MNLPQITIPVNIPFDIPTMLHQPLVHFAIAIPVLMLLIEIVNLFLNNTTLKVTTSLFMLLLVAVLFGAYLTGTTDGKHAIDNGFNAISELKEHKLYGIYLFYASIFVLLIKLISVAVNKVGFKLFYLLILIGFVSGILYQGKEGGELVFEHATNVQMQKDEFDDDDEEETTTTKITKEVVKTQPKEKSEAKKSEPVIEKKVEEVKTETTKATQKTEQSEEKVEQKEEIKAEPAKEETKSKEVAATQAENNITDTNSSK